MHQEEGFKFCLDTKSNRALPWLLYFNTVVASNVQLGLSMRFAMECFNPYPLASNSIWLSILYIITTVVSVCASDDGSAF